ncbi:MAG: PAS domain S-box protein [Proteobacteria bacterium]|nr:PAS domain S-box protein [Pseudomonadota bacterium]MBU1059163.1 PAS domain S-box protein [Pseudomonadota bacterium]
MYSNKPLVFQDEAGEFQGLTIDVLRYIASQEGWNLQFKEGSWPECLERLEKGEIDLQVAIAMSVERAKIFSYPQQTLLTNWGRLYRHPGAAVESILDLDGKTVALLEQDIHAKVFIDLMEKFGKDVKLVYVKNYDDVLVQVERGTVDVGVVNRMYAMQNAHRFQVETTPMIFNPIEVRYAAPKGKNSHLLQAIDHHLQILRKNKDSVYYQSLEKWFGQSHVVRIPAWIQPALLIIGGLFVLVFAISLLLRRQVAVKTGELKDVNQQLTAQIQQQQLVEEALRGSEEKLRTLIETTDTAYFVVDKYGIVYETNSEYVRLAGYKNFAEIKGRSVLEWTAEHDRERNRRGLARCYSEGVIRNLEIDYIDLDKHITPVEINASVFRKNDQTWILGMLRDITERKEAAAALQKEKELLSVTLRSIGDGVITTDTDGKITFLNKVAEKLTGWSDEEARGQRAETVFHIINEKTGERCPSPVQRVIEQARKINLAYHTALIAKDGSRKTIADSGAPIRNRMSTIVGVVIVFRDVTNEYRMEEEVLKIRKLESLGVLAGGIAHDFNNILSGILGNIELAHFRIAEKDEEAASLLSDAQKATRRAGKLTHQLLTFSKGGDPVRESTSLPELVRESAAFVLQGSKIACDYFFAEGLWAVDVDSGQISQVIQNIILNADHAMPEGGRIRINCTNVVDPASEVLLSAQEGHFVRIILQDSGIGIPPDILDKIFDPYFSTKQYGSGLGLAICHSIINKHEGYLTVDSIPGKGTTFTIYLPAVLSKTVSISEKSKIVVAGKAARIMIMDDEEMLRDVAGAQLIALGHEAVPVSDGEEAIRRYQALRDLGTPVDLVIMDLTIPGGMGGQEAAQKLLQIDPQAKIIVASGYSNDPVMANCREHGFVASIAKPFDMRELGNILTSVL